MKTKLYYQEGPSISICTLFAFFTQLHFEIKMRDVTLFLYSRPSLMREVYPPGSSCSHFQYQRKNPSAMTETWSPNNNCVIT